MDMLGNASHQQKPIHTHTHTAQTDTNTLLTCICAHTTHTSVSVWSECSSWALLYSRRVVSSCEIWSVAPASSGWGTVTTTGSAGVRGQCLSCVERGQTLFNGFLVSWGRDGVRARVRLGAWPFNHILCVGSENQRW